MTRTTAAASSSAAPHKPREEPLEQSSFPLFNYLHEDLKILVVSYVADAPFETNHNKRYPSASLTHTLPQVSRKFRNICDTDYFWKDAIVRQTVREPFLWKQALQRILELPGPNQDNDTNDVETALRLVVSAFEHVQYEGGFKEMYQTIVSKHLRFVGPVFCTGGQVSLGQPYSLHFFEPRYRKMIAEVMEGQPESAKRGGRVHGHSAMFVHANRGPLEPTTPATLVQVQQCEIFGDGRANVVLMPVAYVWLERLWVRPSVANDLCYAQCLRMGRKVTQSMNQLARQEQLAYVMSQLVNNLGSDGGDTSDDALYESDEF